MKAVPWFLLLALAATFAGPASGRAPDAAHTDSAHGILPPPHGSPPGTLRIWGHPQAEEWLSRQADRFAQRHPDIRIEPNLTGSDVGMAALYSGQADIVLMGREATASEVQAFEWVHRYRPTAVPILTGSLDRAGQAPALVIFVHRDNPLGSLSLAQLDGIFGTAREHGWHDGKPVPSAARGADRDIRRWGQLGLDGVWLQRAIRMYAPMAESGTGKFFRVRVLADSNRMHWDALEEFADPVHGAEDSGARILAALADDPAGIAVSNLQFARPEVKAVALIGDAGEPVMPTPDALVSGRYPLARTVYAYINRPAQAPVDPQVMAWLTDVLGEPARGREDGAGFLPLSESRRLAAIRHLSATQPAE